MKERYGSKERPKNSRPPSEAHVKGIYLVPQEPMLFPYLTIEENIFLGMTVDKKVYKKGLGPYMDALKCDFTLEQIGADLTIAKQQLVALLRGLMRESEAIILDEPTSALTAREVNAMFRTIKHMIKKERWQLCTSLTGYMNFSKSKMN